MPYLIDAHQDLAYNAKTFGRDIRRSAYETRRLEQDSNTVEVNGHSLLGWPEYQRGQVGLVFCSLFVMSRSQKPGWWETQVYATPAEAYRLTRSQLDFYNRLGDESSHQFQLVTNRSDLKRVLQPWENQLAQPPSVTHPVGLVLTIEGAEGFAQIEELEEWWQAGVRIIGPVWAGTRYCGSITAPGRFTKEGFLLLERMADLGYTLDIAHMSEESVLQVLDIYPGAIIASHANAAALIESPASERHLSDRVLRRLAERDGVMGVIPYNRFLQPGWTDHDPREEVSLHLLLDHIDHICQMCGSADQIGLGSDYDGGFGWPAVPFEVDTVADLQKLAPLMEERGFNTEEIEAFFHSNWRRILERTLPA